MIYKIKTIVLILFIGLPLNSCSDNVDDKPLKVASVEWDLLRRSALTSSAIWSMTDYKEEHFISDQNYINQIKEMIKELDVNDDILGTDVRISVLILNQENSTDTLSFGTNKVIQLNDKYYNWDDDLFEHILSVISDDHRKTIREIM